MGDVAMTAPVLAAVARKYGSEVEMVMLTPKFYTPFFFDSPELKFYDIDLYGRHSGIRGVRKLARELMQHYDFDAVVDLHDKLYSKLLRYLFRKAKIPTYTIDKGGDDKRMLTRKEDKVFVQLKSTIQRYCDVFGELGYEIAVPNVMPLRGERRAPEFAGTKSQGYWVGIAPFAKHDGKILPLHTVRKVIEGIAEKHPDWRIFLFGGGRAEAMVADSLVAWYPNCTSALGKATLTQEMDLMASLDVMLTMDSSAMHLCSLVGTPAVSVWGATHPYAGFLGLGQDMRDVVQIPLECRPCSIYGNKPCHREDYACLKGISTQSIIEHLEACLLRCEAAQRAPENQPQ